MIVDMHTHYGEAFEQRDGLDPARWLAPLEDEGVSGAVVLPLRGLMAHEDVPASNDALARLAAAAPDRIVAFGAVHPFAGRCAPDEAERCLRTLGMKGIKLHPWLQGFPCLGGPALHAICEVCEAAGAPILLHDGTSNVSLPAQVALLARQHPRMTFLLGHAGLQHLWREAGEAACRCPNVHLILCGPPLAGLRHLCARVPADRLLWGSDYGMSFENRLPYYVGIMRLLGLNDSQYRAIMEGNACRLLGRRPPA